MDRQEIIDKTREFVKNKLDNDSSGHDWQHVARVANNALVIGEKENADLFIVELAALLHDIADWKTNDESESEKVIKEWLSGLDVSEEVINSVVEIVKTMSFKGMKNITKMATKEGQVVQDADRLEAIGAVGIGRCFTYAGSKGIMMHDSTIMHDVEGYENKVKGVEKTTAINHFYEKLFHLRDLMNTETAKEMAKERHDFMEKYLEQFLKEVNL